MGINSGEDKRMVAAEAPKGSDQSGPLQSLQHAAQLRLRLARSAEPSTLSPWQRMEEPLEKTFPSPPDGRRDPGAVTGRAPPSLQSRSNHHRQDHAQAGVGRHRPPVLETDAVMAFRLTQHVDPPAERYHAAASPTTPARGHARHLLRRRLHVRRVSLDAQAATRAPLPPLDQTA